MTYELGALIVRPHRIRKNVSILISLNFDINWYNFLSFQIPDEDADLGDIIVELAQVRGVDTFAGSSEEIAFSFRILFFSRIDPFIFIFIESRSAKIGILQHFLMHFLRGDRIKTISNL